MSIWVPSYKSVDIFTDWQENNNVQASSSPWGVDDAVLQDGVNSWSMNLTADVRVDDTDTEMSMFCFFKTTNGADAGLITGAFFHHGGSNQWTIFMQSDGTIKVSAYKGQRFDGVVSQTTNSYGDDEWHGIGITQTLLGGGSGDAEVKIFVDKVEDYSQENVQFGTGAGDDYPVYHSSRGTSIGGHGGVAGHSFAGEIARWAIDPHNASNKVDMDLYYDAEFALLPQEDDDGIRGGRSQRGDFALLGRRS